MPCTNETEQSRPDHLTDPAPLYPGQTLMNPSGRSLGAMLARSVPHPATNCPSVHIYPKQWQGAALTHDGRPALITRRFQRRVRDASVLLEPHGNEVRIDQAITGPMARTIRRKQRNQENRQQCEARPGHDVVKLLPCRCRRAVCKACGRVVGHKYRHGLKKAVKRLQANHGCAGDVQMWTLTVDPKRYESPQGAHDDVARNRRISRLMSDMGVDYWACVVEWHESGWPHWHVLVWMPVKRVYLDHQEVTAAWKIGHTLYSSSNGRPAEWAVNYVTKYLTKPKRTDPPEWIMDRSHVRMIWASRAFGPVVSAQHDDMPPDDQDAAPERVNAGAASNRAALSNCSQATIAIRESVSSHGVLRREYLGSSCLPWRAARELAHRMTEGAAAGGHVCKVISTHDRAFNRLIDALHLVGPHGGNARCGVP